MQSFRVSLVLVSATALLSVAHVLADERVGIAVEVLAVVVPIISTVFFFFSVSEAVVVVVHQ